ncbi:MAG TPA: FAD-linked oxidase [Actinobacteria bacterium]|nr:FAD-linked oxidase [Actinomycetota bacterium]
MASLSPTGTADQRRAHVATVCPVTAVPTQAPWQERYSRLRDTLLQEYRAIPPGTPIRLAKHTSNLFRPRDTSGGPGLDVAAFDGVLHVDPVTRTAEVLGMTTYEHLVDATLPYGLMPMCVPQLRTITLGGAVTGLGIESASFRSGTPHESVLEMDILTGDGQILTVTGDADDPHRDLFYGFPNSYGSLGYALRLRIELEPTKPYVLLRHVRYATAAAMTEAIQQIAASREFEGRTVDFLDGTVFSTEEQYLSIGTMVDALPAGLTTSDYTGMGIYYRSIQARTVDALTIHDYLWRWDTDWFWCSRAFMAQKPIIRRLWPKSRLRSDVYWKLVAFERRHDLSNRVARRRGRPVREAVVQDIEVPADRLPEFLEFFHREVGIEPVWICPLQQRDPQARWPLYEFDPTVLYVNVGFWSTVALPDGVSPEEGRVNRRIEEVVTQLDGRKSLYSTAFYDREAFWSIYGGNDYPALKGRYDPDSRLKDLYAKVVERK